MIKNFFLLCMLFLFLNFMCFAQEDSFKSYFKIEGYLGIADAYTTFVQHLWPNENTIKTKSIAVNSLSPEEINKFKINLYLLFNQSYAPAEGDFEKNLVLFENYFDNSDCLIFKYKKNGYNFIILDYLGLMLYIEPEIQEKNRDIKLYVEECIFKILQMPRVDEDGKQPESHSHETIINELKIVNGSFFYRKSFYPVLKKWYSQLTWWSDGNSILLSMPKIFEDKDQIDYSRSAKAPTPKPRKFKKKAE